MKNKNNTKMNRNNGLTRFAVKSDRSNDKKLVNNAIIYTRVSSIDQAKYGKSLEWQLEDCQDYCKKNGYNILKEFGDTFESAKTDDDRAQFQDMLHYIQKNKDFIGHVVIWNMDRFSRSGELIVLEMLAKAGIRLHCVKQGFDSTTVSGKFEMNLYAIIAKWENEQRKEKTVRGMKNKLRSGEVVTKPPIGYEKRVIVKDGPALCYIDEKGKLIRQAFLWAAEGNVTQVEILNRLENMGLKLASPQLSRILRNPFYCGYITNKLLDEGEMILGKHEPLITEKLFLKVNSIISDNPQGWKIKKEKDEMPLKIFVKCGNCGRSLTCYQRKQIYFYYKCPNHGCCVNLRNNHLHELFVEKIKQLTVNPDLIPMLQVQLSTIYWNLHDSDLQREKPLKDELAKLKKDFDAIEYNFSAGKISVEVYTKHTTPLQQRIMSIEEDLAKISKKCSNLENNLRDALENSCNLHKIWELLDYSGKQRLQYLIFPAGILYFKETDEIRTPEINPFFPAIAHLTKVSEGQGILDTGKTDQGLPQVYLGFGSSNFFEVQLKAINDDYELLNICYPDACKSMRCTYINPITGNTEYVQFDYVSNMTGSTYYGHSQFESSSITSGLNLPFFNHYNSGGTIYSGGTI